MATVKFEKIKSNQQKYGVHSKFNNTPLFNEGVAVFVLECISLPDVV